MLACIFVLRLPLPEPPDRYLLTEATLVADETEQPVRLPYHLPAGPPGPAPQTFTLSFERPASEARQGLVGDRAPLHQRASRSRSTAPSSSTAAAIPPPTGRTATCRRSSPSRPCCCATGRMLLTIRLHVWGPLTGFLDQRLCRARTQALRPAYDNRIAAVPDAAGRVFRLAGHPCRPARRDVVQAAPRAGLWGACRRHGARRRSGVRPGCRVMQSSLCRAECRPHRLGAARSRLRARLRRRLSRLEIAAIRLGDFRAGISGRRHADCSATAGWCATRLSAARPSRRCSCRWS